MAASYRCFHGTCPPPPKGHTHHGGDEDKEGVAVDAHGLQEGVQPHALPDALAPPQKAPQCQRHQPGVAVNSDASHRHCRARQAVIPGALPPPAPPLPRGWALPALLTFVELGAVVDGGVLPLGQHQGQVAGDGQDKGQCGADPERACGWGAIRFPGPELLEQLTCPVLSQPLPKLWAISTPTNSAHTHDNLVAESSAGSQSSLFLAFQQGCS